MSKRKGFTLVELLVVIAIIALLMSILLPSLTRAKMQAKEAICMSNLRQWGTIFSMYTNDNDGLFNRGWPSEGGDDWGFAGGHTWPLALRPYYSGLPAKHEADEDSEAWGQKKIRFCPMATRPYGRESRVAYCAWIQPDTLEPGGFAEPCGSYGTNEWTGNQPEDEERIPGANWKTANVKNAGNIPLIMDCAWAGGFPEDTHDPPAYEGYMSLSDDEIIRYVINRHNYKVIVCFVDYSVRKVDLKELFVLKWHRLFRVNGPWTLAGGVTRSMWQKGAPWMLNLKDY
jgi:prepilin-type N-terminal cleavage/methylation domain-containing protein